MLRALKLILPPCPPPRHGGARCPPSPSLQFPRVSALTHHLLLLLPVYCPVSLTGRAPLPPLQRQVLACVNCLNLRDPRGNAGTFPTPRAPPSFVSGYTPALPASPDGGQLTSALQWADSRLVFALSSLSRESASWVPQNSLTQLSPWGLALVSVLGMKGHTPHPRRLPLFQSLGSLSISLFFHCNIWLMKPGN